LEAIEIEPRSGGACSIFKSGRVVDPRPWVLTKSPGQSQFFKKIKTTSFWLKI